MCGVGETVQPPRGICRAVGCPRPMPAAGMGRKGPASWGASGVGGRGQHSGPGEVTSPLLLSGLFGRGGQGGMEDSLLPGLFVSCFPAVVLGWVSAVGSGKVRSSGIFWV